MWAAAAVSFLALLILTGQAPAEARQAADASSTAVAKQGGPGDAVLDVVMLVDESGSETAASVADERQTAGTIGQAMLNPRSRVTVVGFGGVNHVAPNQDPVNVACQPTIATGAVHLSYLAKCVNSLHRRTLAEGDDTDYAAALGQAMSYFNPDTTDGRHSPAGAIKVILMMTDGGLDVHNDTQQYGTNWLAGAHHAVNLQLAAARAAGVQVWPLGFGSISAANHAYLNFLAANGAHTACDNRHESRPRAMVVNNPDKALAALDTLYAAAGCLGSNSSTTTLGGNQTRWLQVSIPGIASDAAISVARGNPGVQVSFYEPDGTLWAGASALSGIGTPVEVLHLSGPQPGQWRIKLTAPPGLKRELVRATAFWQGAVDAIMTATPSSAQPGQKIDITLSVLDGNRPITDPATLAHMQVVVSVRGEGLSEPTTIPVSNAGETSGTTTGVGDYKGTFTAPRGHGPLTFSGTAAGYGLYATQVPAQVQVGGGTPGFQSTIQPPVTFSVLTGQSIDGKVLFANTTGATRTVRLSLGVRHAYATITRPTGAIQARSGNPPATTFTITFAGNSPVGPALLQVKVLDAAHPGTVYTVATLLVDVSRPPGPLAKFRWEIIGALILLVLGVLLIIMRRRARRKAADVRGLFASIQRNGERIGVELKAPGKRADEFRFVIRDEGEATERLDYPRSDDRAYSAQRGRAGQLNVSTPAGEQYEITVGGSGEPLPSGLRLAFRDMRRPAAGTRRSSNGTRSPVPAPPPPDTNHGRPSPPVETDDPWLN
jgi:hypothetical protein